MRKLTFHSVGQTESEEQSEFPRTLHSAFTASLEVGLMKSLPPSPTRHSRGSAHSISMMGGTAAIISARMVTVTFLVSFLQFNLCQEEQGREITLNLISSRIS